MNIASLASLFCLKVAESLLTKNRLFRSAINLHCVERDNFGIKILYEDPNILLLWKSGNVAIDHEQDTLLRRKAAPCIQTWSVSYLKKQLDQFSISAPTLDNPTFSGNVLIFKSPSVAELFGKCGCFTYRYSALVIMGANTDASLLSKRVGHQIIICKIVRSGTFSDGLALINVLIKGENITISQLVQLLDLAGCRCVSGSYISLMEIIVFSESPAISAAIEDPALFKSSQQEISPKKFLKFLRREELLHSRQQELSKPSAVELTAENSHESNAIVNFRGLSLVVPHESLQPRASSGILVDTALLILRNRPAKSSVSSLRILDIGCGSGALLLSIINEFHLSEQSDNESVYPRIGGVGIDIDSRALLSARQNTEAICLKENQSKHPIFWHQVDFTRLCDENRRFSLNGSEEWGPFDVVVCNPPFLSERASGGRITSEGKGSLVGGRSGLEAYESICKGIVDCERSECSRPLLTSEAVIIFQTPGGDNGRRRVAQTVTKLGFEIVDGMGDNRRCLVVKRKKQ